MKKQLVIIGITLVLLVVGLSGCNQQTPSETNNNQSNDQTDNQPVIKTDKDKFIGTWKSDSHNNIFIFNENSTYRFYSADNEAWDEGNWYIEEDSKTVTLSEMVFEYHNYRIMENSTGYIISLQGVHGDVGQTGDWFNLTPS